MMNNVKCFVAILLSIAIILPIGNITVCAVNVSDSENNYSQVDWDTVDCAKNRLIIVLDNKESLKFTEYNLSDFAGIDCKQIVDLTSSTNNMVEERVDDIERHIWMGEDLPEYKGTSLDEYNRILSLELNDECQEDLSTIIEQISQMEGVLYVCPDYEIKACSIPDDDYWVQGQGSVYNLIDLTDAWNITQGSSSVRVGILDSGIDESHPDLVDNINSNLCRSFLNNAIGTCTHDTDDDHGTMVAGVIGAKGDNGLGVCGVCWNVELVSLRVIDDGGSGYSSYAIKAIDYAIANSFDILNMSFGWSEYILQGGSLTNNPYYNLPMEEAINNFNGLVVCAAGNINQGVTLNNDLVDFYPSSYNLPNIVSVGASNNADGPRDDSHYGATTVDLFAPGDGIYSTSLDSSYAYFLYTSAATALVSGVAALMLSVNPTLFPEEIKHMLMAGTDQVSALSDKCVSGGRLNALNAVEYARDHQRQYIGSNVSGHTYRCLDCGYYETTKHTWFIVTETDALTGLNCSVCGYAYPCYCHPEYEQLNSDYHKVYCDTCNYSFIESHNDYVYARSNSQYYHITTCGDCGYSYNESHNWVTQSASLYRCTLCGQLSSQNVVMGMPPEENELTE